MKASVKLLSLVGLGIAVLIAGHVTYARQGANACPEVARQALAVVEAQCVGTGRNEVCYGHVNLEAQPQPYITDFNFDSEGDVVGIAELHTLRLDPVDPRAEAWGIALMRMQADLPANTPPTDNVTLVMFGDTALENTAPDLPQIAVQVASAQNANIRQLPRENALVMGVTAPGETLAATGRLADGSWLRVAHPATGVSGWIAAGLVSSEDDLGALAVVGPGDRFWGAMQALAFESGPVTEQCPEAPNGLLIQTPEGEAKVTFLVNEIVIQLGSTVYFRSERGVRTTIAVLEGAATVEALGRVTTIPAGGELSVPIDETLKATGFPGPLRGYNPADVAYVPLALLPRAVEIAPPLDAAALAALEPPPPTVTPTSAPVEVIPPPAENPPAAPPKDEGKPPAPPGPQARTATPVPTPNESCPPDPVEWQPLRLTSMCSPDPDSYRVWRVRNMNPVAVDFTWTLYGAEQGGEGTVPAMKCGIAGETTFTTGTQPGPNTVGIFVDGVQQDVKASNPEVCP